MDAYSGDERRRKRRPSICMEVFHTEVFQPYFSAIKKNEIMPFAATWMDLEGIILSEKTSDRER